MTSSPQTAERTESSLGPYDLFGHAIRVVVDDSPVRRILREELSLYPASVESTSRTVRVTHHPAPGGGSVNPALHRHLDDGFVARYPNAAVRFRFAGSRLEEIVLHLPAPLPGLRGARSRWRHIQYSTSDEMSGQTLHELALVPSLYFDDDRVPIHASAISLPGEGMVLIGGTGGVGKTTLALDLCLRYGASFAADDIAVVDAHGRVHPNLAYPKVYAYNLHGDAELATRVLGAATLPDRLQWRWRVCRAGPAKVRRRVSPARLCGAIVTEPAPLRRYLFLVREHRPSVLVEPATPARMAAMSVAVLQGEYDRWHRHLVWDEFNALAIGSRPRLHLADRLDGFTALLERLLVGVDCTLVRVPIELDHRAVRRSLSDLLAKQPPLTRD